MAKKKTLPATPQNRSISDLRLKYTQLCNAMPEIINDLRTTAMESETWTEEMKNSPEAKSKLLQYNDMLVLIARLYGLPSLILNNIVRENANDLLTEYELPEHNRKKIIAAIRDNLECYGLGRLPFMSAFQCWEEEIIPYTPNREHKKHLYMILKVDTTQSLKYMLTPNFEYQITQALSRAGNTEERKHSKEQDKQVDLYWDFMMRRSGFRLFEKAGYTKSDIKCDKTAKAITQDIFRHVDAGSMLVRHAGLSPHEKRNLRGELNQYINGILEGKGGARKSRQ